MVADDLNQDPNQPKDQAEPDQTTIPGRLQYLQKYQEMLDDPQYAQEAPASSRQTLQQTIDAAKGVYDKEKNVNDWAEVAQLVGRAGAQYAAARSGLNTNRNMGALDTGNTIDYNARNNRAFDEYKQTVGDASKLSDSERQRILDQNATKRATFSQKEGMYKEGIDTARDQDRAAAEDQREKNMNTRNQLSERGQNLRAQRALDAQTAQGTRQDKQIQAASLNQEIKDQKKELQDVRSAVPAIAEELDGSESPKEIAAFRNKHARELGSLDPADIQDAQKQAQVPGMLYGTNFDKDKFQQALSDKVTKKKGQELTNLRQALDRLTQGRSSSAAPAPAPTNDSKTMTQQDLAAYASMHKIEPDAAQKFLESQGYSIK